MDYQSEQSEIDRSIDALLGGGEMKTIGRTQAETVLSQLAQRVARRATDAVLFGLMGARETAEELGISLPRLYAKAAALERRGFPPGWRIPGTRRWVFHRERLENLRAVGAPGRPRK